MVANAFTIGKIENGWLITSHCPNGHQHTCYQPTLEDIGKWLIENAPKCEEEKR